MILVTTISGSRGSQGSQDTTVLPQGSRDTTVLPQGSQDTTVVVFDLGVLNHAHRRSSHSHTYYITTIYTHNAQRTPALRDTH